MLVKSIPMVILAAGAVKNKDKIERILEAPKIAATQMEIGTIARMFTIDLIDREPIEPENFPEFVRSTMRSQTKGSRADVALDMWGRPYLLKYQDNYAVIYSTGPDKLDGTDDDIRTQVSLD